MRRDLDLPSEDVDVAIIGSGFSGLGMAIMLQQAGREDFVVLERAEEVGGTWRDNHYPGAACDVPSRLYSFSFAPDPGWTRSFSRQPEILSYLKGCADRFGVREKIAFGATLQTAAWDEDAQRWRLETSRGWLRARVLVVGAGALSTPKAPGLPGVERFAGQTFHSAAWDDDVDLTGKRVAVVGTGASAIQIVPELQRDVAHLDLYQRTPAWLVPRGDRAFTRLERWATKTFPLAGRAARAAIYWARELYVLGFTSQRWLMKGPERISRRMLARQVADPVKRAGLLPDYAIGCKRILVSNDFWPAVDQPNVELITSGIEEVTEHGIVTTDGVEHPADVIVWATGFQVTPPPIGEAITGRNGRTLGEVWDHGGQRAHRGTTFPAFPNLFQLAGPNTGLAHSSMVYMIEAQIAYVLAALQAMDAHRLGAIEPAPTAQAAWNAQVQEQLITSVWQEGGCASWYLDQHGENVTLWPDFTFRFKHELARFDAENYDTRPPAGVEA